ncbi:uncharacterized protein LAESUDRAFT_147937 [Laetiporus sulphureus 93-53]|uniref:Uncharacterized protein n=1 Tax=Laetiporus sulphureus 93-53 TaxID=1314785 RepID=A0A165EBL8_9APHY|nr:uncharacterized protein LAESUDRAFT_147937 [Laetiporus sulphureus 93-53]KZT06676.1 hypothetical protein LAESUDRAFT_147937 [Laetiporus sulphureus 93-53]
MSIPATPARAITSILSNRSAPSIPPASQTYEPLVKAVLRQRLLYYILLPAFAYTWLIANMWSVWSQGGMAHIGIWATVVNSVRPLTWIYAMSMWLLGAVPAIILSNRFLSGESKRISECIATTRSIKSGALSTARMANARVFNPWNTLVILALPFYRDL